MLFTLLLTFAHLQVCKVFWSRQPDAWDAQWEAEEQARRLKSEQVCTMSVEWH
jgi:hypothetical protein